MNKIDKKVLYKYKMVLFGTLFILYFGYIIATYFYNEHLIGKGDVVSFDPSFPIVAVSVIFITAIIFKIIEEFNNI